MKTIVCVLLAAVVMTAARPQTQTDQQSTTLSTDPVPAADAALAVDSSPVSSSATEPGQNNLGSKFFGPGLMNPIAIPIDPSVEQHAQQVISTHPDLWVFVDIDGTAHFTDKYGRERDEVLDAFGRDLTEIFEVQEQQDQFNGRLQEKLLLRARYREFERRLKQVELKLRQERRRNPTAFDPPAKVGGLSGGPGGKA